MICHDLPDYLREEILLHPEKRNFPSFDLSTLLHTVFTPTEGCKVCVLLDFDEPAAMMKDYPSSMRRDFRFRSARTSIFTKACNMV